MEATGTRRVIVSGGIGAGKSLVAALLADRGALVIDADQVGHQVIATGGPAFAAVSERWPDVVVDGEIDRRALGQIVFSDHSQLEELEALTHPAIAGHIQSMIADHDGLVAVELPVLRPILGEGWFRVVVDVSDEARWERLRSRGLDDDEIASRIAAQPSREDWLEAADYVVENSGTVDDLEEKIERLWEMLGRS